MTRYLVQGASLAPAEHSEMNAVSAAVAVNFCVGGMMRMYAVEGEEGRMYRATEPRELQANRVQRRRMT